MSCTNNCGGSTETQDASTDEQVQIAPEPARPATLTPEQPVKAPGQGGDILLTRGTPVEVEWPNGYRPLRYVDEGGYQLTAEDVGNGSPYSWGDGRIVRVFADVTPPQPDPRVEVVARALHRVDPSHDLTCEDQDWAQWRVGAGVILDALDAMGTAPDERRGL